MNIIKRIKIACVLSGGESEYIQIKIAGENQPMNVDFTKTLLYGDDADLAVANEYRFNTQYYKALITKYPEFEDLIIGVLNPVPPSISIPANDGEILYCGGYLKTLPLIWYIPLRAPRLQSYFRKLFNRIK